MPKFNSIKELEEYRKKLAQKYSKIKKIISVCTGTNCKAFGGDELVELLREELEKRGLEYIVHLREIKETTQNSVCHLLATGCRGFCEKGILVNIEPNGIFYQQVRPEDAKEIIEETIINNKVIERLLYKDPNTGELLSKMEEIPFYKYQKPFLLGNNRKLNPQDIDDYIYLGGYSALAKALSKMTPEQIINEVIEANLRGRGGGGFPAGLKWKSCREAEGFPKYVIANGDEGDPGAFMDRSLMEGNPHSIIEGMIIGSFAIGSNFGYIYVRNEYPLAVKNLSKAIQEAEEYGLLGENILGSGHSFTIKINRGGGAFVCGESTALMASIEGKVGEPRAKHIHTVVKGLWNKPTNLNNVETWANVPLIINNGAEWYKQFGTEGSKGTKIFSLTGKVYNTGLVEVPMGITLRDIIYKIGGGIRNNKRFKGVQTGGPSGGVIPEKYLDLPIDFDELTKVGSMMGSGGMIVMDEDTCMVDVAKYFTGFLKFESCGKCTSCREGLVQLYNVLERITQGEGKIEDLTLIEELSEVIAEGSLCALGGTAPNPVMSTLNYFREEYEAHIKYKACPAKVCKALIYFVINPEKCTGCTLCAKRCPVSAISGDKKKPHVINQEKCIKCRICYTVCPEKWSAVEIHTGSKEYKEVTLND